MNNSTIAWVLVTIIIIAGGWYVIAQKNGSVYSTGNTPTVTATPTVASSVTPTPTPTTTSTAPTAKIGEHCGGNMMNAPVCASGSHCAPTLGSKLPFGDVGGTCVKDSPSAYIPGNLLLGTDVSATLGAHLIASNGMTLYHSTKDKSGVSNCTGTCATIWLPYTVSSTDVLSNIQAGVSGKVGTITRADGSMQVTYNGIPLYIYASDRKSGDVGGQNFGGTWFVVNP